MCILLEQQLMCELYHWSWRCEFTPLFIKVSGGCVHPRPLLNVSMHLNMPLSLWSILTLMTNRELHSWWGFLWCSSEGRTVRRWVWPKTTNIYYTASLAPSSELNGGAAVDKSGAAIKKVSEERQTDRRAHTVKMRTWFAVYSGRFFSPQCKSERKCVSSNICADARPANVGWVLRKRSAKFAPDRQWCGVSPSVHFFFFLNQSNA